MSRKPDRTGKVVVTLHGGLQYKIKWDGVRQMAVLHWTLIEPDDRNLPVDNV